ncbi:Gryzun, putative trafficking through golgi-domain-containing protein [Amylocystis lapponica]|nr:Gryzun, putative trafficking through golgi-domain-containing protein [Amylocystis lapponica]
MNSYPPELLTQLAPVMFAAGLDSPSPAKTPDPFALLSARLRDALLAQRNTAVWQPEKTKAFHVLLVDKDVRFPPRKLLHPDDPQYHTAHSPLSPLTPTSPLHPDGLIAPIWLRKHTTLVPSVFVLFTRIFESPPPAARAPLDAPDAERERDAEERRRDADLAAEIAQRKRTTGERGVKLTVVLMASRRMLDDPALDARLTYIRRQSGLDPRAALFVLSPVTQAEIGDFVRSLQEALYEAALEYYTNHSKRVRRKRNRHAQGTGAHALQPSPLGGAVAARPLRPEGWTVRYEYKMACFAEFRGEDEVALKHYQDAYAALLTMFGSTAILPPRTKRWAEAKVLADAVNVKICKLYLYNNEHALALAHHNSHMRKFADFSRGWGIGEETFEFWSWLARQHRVFAELLEQGTHSTLRIPTQYAAPLPAAALAAAHALDGGQRTALELEAMRTLGLNPNHALQHPGFYYYMAARCTERRRERFLSAVEAETTSASPGFTNEKKVDHLVYILELYTRSYDLFRHYNPVGDQSQGRLTLWIAYLIAHTYYESGKFDLAVRFFERIAKTYRREKWDSLLRPLLSTWYACAQQMGDMELSVRLLFEMLGCGVSSTQDDPDAVQEDLLAVLRSSVPSTPNEPFVVDSSDSEPILDSSLVFWHHEVNVGEVVAFQLILTALKTVPMSLLPFSSLTVHFQSDIPPIVIRHAPASSEDPPPAVQKVDLGHASLPLPEGETASREIEGNLRWRPGSSIVLCGSISSDEPMVIKISRLVLTMKEASWSIEIPLHPISSRNGFPLSPKWLRSLDPVQFTPIRSNHHSSAIVHHRRHAVQVSLAHSSPAYAGEQFPIVIDVRNADEKELDVVVDVLLQPPEVDEAVNYIVFGEERSTSLIKGVALGAVAPGSNVMKTLYLDCVGTTGDRVVDISVQSRTISTSSGISSLSPVSPESPSAHAAIDRSESLHTVVVQVVDAIHVEHAVSYRRSLKPQPGLADLRTFDREFWDDGDGGEAVVSTVFSCVAPSGVMVESISLSRHESQYAEILDYSSGADSDELPMELLTGDEICDRSRISLAPGEQHLFNEAIQGPGEYAISWRRICSDGTFGSLAVTRFNLPALRPPVDELIALLSVPPTAKLHVPISLHLTIRNRHPSRAANVVVQLEPDSSDGFVVAGLRSGRMPILLPGSEETIMWRLVPIDCGFVRVPRVKVMNRRKTGTAAQAVAGEAAEAETEGELVQIVDVRWDSRSESGEEAPQVSLDGVGDGAVPRSGGESTVLVLP